VRVLVTGSSGFVGRHLCRFLTAIGDDVVACPGPEGPDSLDVTDREAVQNSIRRAQPEGIVHLAAMSSVAWSHANPAEAFLVNSLGTANVLQAVREVAPNARLLLVGSGEMYGRITEGHRAIEDDRLQPVSPYAASKCAGEILGRQFASSYDLKVVCSRPFNHLGPGQSPHFVVPSFAQQIAEVKMGKRDPLIEVGDLTPVRDFLHVGDVIRGYRILLERGEQGAVYNVCSGEPLSIKDLLEQLFDIAGVRLEVRIDPTRLRPVEIPWLVGDNSRLLATGWHPEQTPTAALTEVFAEALRR
jgi:GDP-4-dehydro-6-deoxy-D-mannose reductase